MTSIAIAIAEVAVRQDSELEIDRCGYVYVLESECGKFIKIGRSKNPGKRLATLRRACNSSKRYWISVLQGESTAGGSQSEQQRMNSNNPSPRVAPERVAPAGAGEGFPFVRVGCGEQ